MSRPLLLFLFLVDHIIPVLDQPIELHELVNQSIELGLNDVGADSELLE